MTFIGIVLYVLFSVVVLVLSIVVHELTHAFVYWRMTGAKPTFTISMKRFRMETHNNYADITNEQYKTILWGGIVGGFFVVLISADQFNFLTCLTILALYTAGCKGDIQRLKHLYSNKQGTETTNATNKEGI